MSLILNVSLIMQLVKKKTNAHNMNKRENNKENVFLHNK